MYDQFNDKLNNRIKAVFEDYEDDSADKGWEELRKRFPEKKEKRRALIWWNAAAAILLVSFGTWAYYAGKPDKIYLTGRPRIEESTKTKTGVVQPSYGELNRTDNEKIAQQPVPPGPHQDRYAGRKTTGRSGANAVPVSVNGVNNSSLLKAGSSEAAMPASAGASYSEPADLTISDNLPAANVIREEVLFVKAGLSEVLPLPELTLPVERHTNPAPLRQLPVLAALPETKKTDAKSKKSLSFGVYAGSYFNYAQGSESNMNTGAGLISEIAISKRLKISTGIAVAQNTLKYDGSTPDGSNASYAAAPSADSKSLLLGSTSNITAANYNINSYNASLLGLDVPVNLRYSLIQKKHELYFTAGLSSNFFFDESYTYTYKLNTNYQFSQTSEETSSKTEYQSFDLARMLNLSVGFEQPIGKQSKLSFEPFIKYPLGGLGAQDLKFGAAGMNLKLNFSTSKK